jgi:hypothetical protein
MHIFYKESLDAFNLYPQKIKKYKENLTSNKIIWQKYNIYTKYNKNKLNYNFENDKKIKKYEIPIFHIDSQGLHEDLIRWILSFEINDIIRIMVENDLLFNPNGTLFIKN